MQTLLTLLLLPPTGFLLLALVAVVVSGRRGRWPALAALLLALAASTEALVSPLAEAWAGSAPAAQTLQQAEAWATSGSSTDTVVLVLGAGVRDGAGADGGFDLKPLTAERLMRGQWWRQRLHLPLAFSGGVSKSAEAGSPSEAEVAALWLRDAGLPPLAWAETRSIDTRSNARESALELQQRGIRRVLLVTHAAHMPRSLRHFRAAAPGVEFLPAPVAVERMGPRRLSDWLPSINGTRQMNYLAYEVVASLVGH